MTQKISPFVESKWGWDYGESGWNAGADENFLKFGFLHTALIDAIVSSLPPVVNDKSYFLTTDNRVYFGVGLVYYSSPVPLWFTLKLKSTGASYYFNGTSLVLTPQPVDLTAVEVKALYESNPNTNAFDDTDKANLGQVVTATQALVDPNKGALTIKRASIALNSIVDLLALAATPGFLDSTLLYEVKGYYSESITGGGKFRWNSSRPKSAHNGGTVIDPLSPWDGTPATLNAFLNYFTVGLGCFEKILEVDEVNVTEFGAVEGGVDCTLSFAKAQSANKNVYLPPGNFVGDITLSRLGTHIRGSGKQNTRVTPVTGHIISALYTKISEISLSPTDSFTGTALTTQVLGGDDSRYITLNSVLISQSTNTARAMLSISTINGFAGYVKLFDCQMSGGVDTIRGDDGEGLISDLQIYGGIISNSGKFCLNLYGVDGANITTTEVGDGGKSVDTAQLDRSFLGGGIALRNCHRVNITSPWFENSVDKYKGVFAENNIFCDANCSDIVATGIREVRENSFGGFSFWPALMATNPTLKFSGNIANPIFPQAAGNSVLNPLLNKFTSGSLTNWSHVGITATRVNTPTGFSSGFTRLLNPEGGASPVLCYFTIAQPGTPEFEDYYLAGYATFSALLKIPYTSGSVNSGLPDYGIMFGIAPTTTNTIGDWTSVPGMYRGGNVEGLRNSWVYSTVTIPVRSRTTPIVAAIGLVQGAEIQVAAISVRAGAGAASYK